MEHLFSVICAYVGILTVTLGIIFAIVIFWGWVVDSIINKLQSKYKILSVIVEYLIYKKQFKKWIKKYKNNNLKY